MLQALFKHAGPMRPAVVSVLLASDQRLLHAAKAEGLEVLNPESVQAVDVPALLAALRSVRQWNQRQTAFGRLAKLGSFRPLAASWAAYSSSAITSAGMPMSFVSAVLMR